MRISHVPLLAVALMFGASSAIAASAGQRACEDDLHGTWDKSTKSCLVEETGTNPGGQVGGGNWKDTTNNEYHDASGKKDPETSQCDNTNPGGRSFGSC
jgi:hypothetical protein